MCAKPYRPPFLEFVKFALDDYETKDWVEVNKRTSKWKKSLHLIFIFINGDAYNLCKLYCKHWKRTAFVNIHIYYGRFLFEKHLEIEKASESCCYQDFY